MCNCDVHSDFDRAYTALLSADVLVEKAFKLSEISSMARAEIRLRKYVEGAWDIRKGQAIKKASTMASKSKSHQEISAVVGFIMNQWSEDILPFFNVEMKRVYKLARAAAHKKSTGQTTASLQFNTPKVIVKKDQAEVDVVFDLVDDEAIAALEARNIFWVGQHYDTNVSESVSKVAKTVMVENGESPKLAGEIIKDELKKILGNFSTPSGYRGTQAGYFEGLVANAMTVGRVYGQLRSFSQVGITEYTIVNPGGDRICEICLGIQGTTFSTQDGLNQIKKEFDAKSPEDIKAIHPWPRDLSEISGKTPASLSAAGFSLPPYHFKCRCTVDVSSTIESYDQLIPMDFPTP